MPTAEPYRPDARMVVAIERGANVAHLMEPILSTGCVTRELLGELSAELGAKMVEGPIRLFSLSESMEPPLAAEAGPDDGDERVPYSRSRRIRRVEAAAKASAIQPSSARMAIGTLGSSTLSTPVASGGSPAAAIGRTPSGPHRP